MTPWWVRASRPYRKRQLRSKQKIERVLVENAEPLEQVLRDGAGVLITPNHSVHYDSAALYLAADQIDCPLFFMVAWQVFAMSSTFEVWAMQRLGCFSVDRESSDRQAFKQAVEILKREPHPLVIFPEGDIYHTTDRICPFREGAAAIAISAAKKADRPVYAVPCGIKMWYLEDPTRNMLGSLEQIEARLFLRPDPSLSLHARIHRVAEAALALKELDYLGRSREGLLRERVGVLLEALLADLESKHQLKAKGNFADRAKKIRQVLIKLIEQTDPNVAATRYAELCAQMGDVFFAMQLYSYPGDYLVDNPSIERMAETVDKFEEDILARDLPSVRGRREAVVRFGEPILVSSENVGRGKAAELTAQLHADVQGLIDQLNADRS